jgi:hypothetical protein
MAEQWTMYQEPVAVHDIILLWTEVHDDHSIHGDGNYAVSVPLIFSVHTHIRNVGYL